MVRILLIHVKRNFSNLFTRHCLHTQKKYLRQFARIDAASPLHLMFHSIHVGILRGENGLISCVWQHICNYDPIQAIWGPELPPPLHWNRLHRNVDSHLFQCCFSATMQVVAAIPFVIRVTCGHWWRRPCRAYTCSKASPKQLMCFAAKHKAHTRSISWCGGCSSCNIVSIWVTSDHVQWHCGE